jgi:hypothetical protein
MANGQPFQIISPPTKLKNKMIEKRYGTLKGLTIPVLVYSSVEEADTAAGKAGAVLDSANDNFHYRGGPAADTRDYICELLEKETSIARKTEPAKDSKGNVRKDEGGNVVMVPSESEGEYAARVCAEKGWDDLKAFQPQIDAWAATAEDGKPLAVDAKTPERKSHLPTKLPARYKEAAAVAITKGTVDAINSAMANTIKKSFTATGDATKMFTGTATVKGTEVPFNVSDKDADTLGRLLKEHMQFIADSGLSGLVG